MAKPSVTDSDLERLADERREADRLYNEALTRVDGALVHPEPLPALPPAAQYRHQQDLNRQWQITAPKTSQGGGWRARVASVVFRVLAPVFRRQEEFNATLVGHINQQAEVEQQLRSTSARLIDAVRREFDALALFQAGLIQFLQQITPYVDTKDRGEAGGLRRQMEERTIALAAGLNGVSDELLRRWESAVTRGQRYEAALERNEAALDQFRISLAGFHGTANALKRELERLASEGSSTTLPAHQGASPGPPPAGDGARSVGQPSLQARPETLGTRLDSAKYVGFEDTFRGSTEEIRSRVLDYLPVFEGTSDVLDLGCGRGEFLEVLAAHGIKGRGVDINPAMVEACRLRGLDVVEGEAVAHLSSLPDSSLGGALAVQVVEHLQADQLVRLLEVAYHKLRPGSRVAIETINPACWYAFFASYIRDITHVHPIHPDTLRYLMVASGFQRVEIRYREPYPERSKLQPVPAERLAHVASVLGEAGETFNENVSKINALLFTYLDYTAIGEKL